MTPPQSPTARRLTVTRGEPLLAYLLRTLQLKRGAVKNLLKFGAVRVNGAAVRQFDHPLATGDRVTVGNLQAAAAIDRLEHARIHTVYEDDALVVVDKPAGLLTVATSGENSDTLYVRLNKYLRDRDGTRGRAGAGHAPARPRDFGPGAAGQIDRGQTPLARGLAGGGKVVLRHRPRLPQTGGRDAEQLFDRRPQVAESLREQRSVRGRPIGDDALSGAENRPRSLAGRGPPGQRCKHQIRVQLANLAPRAWRSALWQAFGDAVAPDRLALHACQLRLAHPLTGQPLRLRSPLPRPLRSLMG